MRLFELHFIPFLFIDLFFYSWNRKGGREPTYKCAEPPKHMTCQTKGMNVQLPPPCRGRKAPLIQQALCEHEAI